MPKDTDIFSYTGINGKNIIIHKYLLNAILYFSSQPLTSTKKDFIINAVICLFGVLLYEMVAGEVSHERGFLETLFSELNEPSFDLQQKTPGSKNEMRNIIKKTLIKDPEQRYKNIKEVLDDLEDVKKSVLSGVKE